MNPTDGRDLSLNLLYWKIGKYPLSTDETDETDDFGHLRKQTKQQNVNRLKNDSGS